MSSIGCKNIIINPIGGLANRMRMLAGGITLAKEIGAEIKVIWLHNWEVSAKFEDVFEMPECLAGKMEYPNAAKYGLLYSIPRKKNLYLSAIFHRRFGLSLFDSVSPMKDLLAKGGADTNLKAMVERTITNGGSCFLQGGTNIYRYSLSDYRDLFVLRKALRERVEGVIESLGDSAVGVHIRRTDNNESRKYSPDSLFMENIEREMDENRKTRFYLASDDDEVKAVFRKRFGDKIITSPISARRDTREGIIHAAMEMFILAGTKKILGSYYSSFSEAAAMLGGCPLVTIMKSRQQG